MPLTPLRRNRDFVLLQSGQLLSSFGTQTTSIAYPLLILATTGSAAKAGFVAFARALPVVLLSLPAGVAADHWNRKWLMILSDAVAAAAMFAVAVAVAIDNAAFGVIVVVAFVEGTAQTLFFACQWGALRAVVPAAQLPDATSVIVGRQAVVRLAGPPFGGALFSVARWLPFLADAASYFFSTVSMLLVRTPFQETRSAEEAETGSLRARLAVGLRFVWQTPFIRTTTLIFGLDNLLLPGALLAVVVLAAAAGLSGGAIGVLVASWGAALLVGSAISPYVRRVLPIRAILPLELWTWAAFVFYVAWPSIYVLAACLALMGLAIPSTDSAVHGYRVAMTPDRLLGRAEAARTTITGGLMPIGPLLVGVLLEHYSGRAVIAALALGGMALAVWATLDRSMRDLPPLTGPIELATEQPVV